MERGFEEVRPELGGADFDLLRDGAKAAIGNIHALKERRVRALAELVAHQPAKSLLVVDFRLYPEAHQRLRGRRIWR